MYWIATLSFVFPLIKFGLSSPAHTEYCTNATVNPTSECWDNLTVTQYLETWWNEHEAMCNTPPYLGDGFASCYQQIVGKGTLLGNACNNISLKYCDPPANFSDWTPQEYYVLASIYGISAWYNSIWIAVGSSAFLVSLEAGRIVEAINPINPGSTSLGKLLAALSAGFAFLGFPASQLGTEGATLVSTAIGQAPGLTKALLNTGTLDSQFAQLNEIESSLETVVEQFYSNLADGLNITQSDFSSFASFAANGSFIAEVTSLNASTTDLTKVFKNFVVSQALQANNVIVTIAPGINPYILANQTFTTPRPGVMLPQNAWHVNCHDSYNGNGYNDVGVCDNWWYDSESNKAYSLFKMDSMGKNYFDLMNQMFHAGWTSGSDLFLGSEKCGEGRTASDETLLTPAPDSQPAYSHFTIDPQTLEVSCNVNLRYCTWNQSNDPRAQDGQEFDFDMVVGCTYAWPDACEPIAVNTTSSFDSSNYMIIQFGPDFNYTGIYGWPSTNLTGIKNCHNGTRAVGKNRNAGGVGGVGWGGVGYQRTSGDECNKYPASYLGPGLWLDTEYCGP